jgi:hypothetical protein
MQNPAHDNNESQLSEREPRADELLVQRYVDGELRPGEAEQLEERLLTEPDLVRTLEHVVRARSSFRHQEPEPAPLGGGFADQVFRAFLHGDDGELREGDGEPGDGQDLRVAQAEVEAPLLPFEHRLRVWALVAASLLILLGAFALFARSGERSGTMMADDSPAQRARTLQELDARARQLELRERAQRQAKQGNQENQRQQQLPGSETAPEAERR